MDGKPKKPKTDIFRQPSGPLRRPICPTGQRCHVNGKGLKRFGALFPISKVRDIASSSVQLVSGGQRLASATLIDPTVVLCSLHTLQGKSLRDLEILMYFECDAKTAPPGTWDQYWKKKASWTNCGKLSTGAQARATHQLEIGSTREMDYALLAIEWKNTVEYEGKLAVRLPRIPVIPQPSRIFTAELLSVGHPWDEQRQGEPTQASPGILRRQEGPNPETLSGNSCAYAGFNVTYGFSGGGVFNSHGQIVGIMLGARLIYDSRTGAGGTAFLRLSSVAEQGLRINRWFQPGLPIRMREDPPGQEVVFLE